MRRRSKAKQSQASERNELVSYAQYMILSSRCQSPIQEKTHLNLSEPKRVVNANSTHDVKTVFIVYTLSFILVFLIFYFIFFRSCFCCSAYKIFLCIVVFVLDFCAAPNYIQVKSLYSVFVVRYLRVFSVLYGVHLEVRW